MRIKHLFFAVLACMAINACEHETPVPDGNDGDIKASYLSVQVANVPTTRAGEVLEDGSDSECKVNSVRLYFFDVNGNASNCVATGTTFQNFYDFATIDQSNVPEENDNIDDKVAAVVVIRTDKGDKLPAKVAAVINVPEGVVVDASTVEKLRANVADFASYTNNNFVMSSTAYAKDGVRIDVTELTDDNFKASAADATAAPVNIYVERVLAKVRVNVGDTSEDDLTVDDRVLYYTGKTSDKTDNAAKKVYVEFLGWTVTATSDKSYLVKNINPAWKDADFFTAWSDPAYYRSYWAINPAGRQLQYYTYNEIKANSKFDGTSAVYCQENASADAAGATLPTAERTKLIVAAQLVNAAGEPITIVEWDGFRYDATDIKTAILASLVDKKITVKDVAISAEDITFKTPIDLGEAYGYEVFVQLAGGITDADVKVDGAATTVAELNATLRALGEIKYWNKGMTYYYTDIKHLADAGKNGEYGVVRNHIYSVNITDVEGLGTPVYDPGEGPEPEEEIIPEKPEDVEAYLAAQINILSWRVVNQNVDLN